MYLPYSIFVEIMCVNMFEVKNMKKRKKKYGKIKGNIIKRQADEIRALKSRINELNITCQQKDEMIESVDKFQQEFMSLIDELKEKKEEYEKLIGEVRAMKKAIDREVFKGRWSIVKWLIK